MAEYRVGTAAFAKLLLHAAKRPEAPAVGLLLGDEQGAAGLVALADAAPLFHHEAPLAPLTEAACAMADVWARQRALKVVGVYVAAGSALGFFEEKLADKVAANFPRACVLLVDSQQLATPGKAAVQLLLKDVKRGWVRVDNRLRLDDDAVAVADDGLKRGAFAEIADFEDHLDDVKQDWRNPNVVELLKLKV